jgi:exopolysaccharide/PEP-CTERM locus tyrosine autokinase
MERIKQALEKAREDRIRAGGMFVPLGTSAPSNSVSNIQYTQTRVMDVDRQHLREQRIITDHERGAIADAYKILRTQLLQRLNDNSWNTLAITSPGAHEGKTLTAINLAINLAQEVTATVLLVDANLQQPGIHNHFGLNPEKGLSDYLTQDTPLAELLIHPAGMDRLVLLPAGRPLANSSEMLNSPKMKHLVEELKERYQSRIILFDLPPLLASSDTLAFSPYVDAALLVIEEGKTSSPDLQQCVELLQTTNLIGTVLNKSRRSSPANKNPEPWFDLSVANLGKVKYLDKIRNSTSRLINRLRKGKS